MLETMFVAEAQWYAKLEDYTLAAKCLVNALCVRNLSPTYRAEIISILGQVQAAERRQWRGQ